MSQLKAPKQLPLYVTKMGEEEKGRKSPAGGGGDSDLGSPDSYGSKSPPNADAMEKALEKGISKLGDEIKFPKQLQEAVSTVLKG